MSMCVCVCELISKSYTSGINPRLVLFLHQYIFFHTGGAPPGSPRPPGRGAPNMGGGGGAGRGGPEGGAERLHDAQLQQKNSSGDMPAEIDAEVAWANVSTVGVGMCVFCVL